MMELASWKYDKERNGRYKNNQMELLEMQYNIAIENFIQ